MSDLNKKLGARIKELRTLKGYKQCEFADLLEMERSHYTRIENGKHKPKDEYLEKIAKILDVTIKDLFDFEHILTDKELKTQIKKELDTLKSNELMCLYKTIKNIKLLRK